MNLAGIRNVSDGPAPDDPAGRCDAQQNIGDLLPARE